MYSYLPSIRSKNEPLMPGKIMADIPIIPQRKINHQSNGVVTGMRDTAIQPKTAPKSTKKILFKETRFSICLPTTKIEAKIKEQQTKWFEKAALDARTGQVLADIGGNPRAGCNVQH